MNSFKGQIYKNNVSIILYPNLITFVIALPGICLVYLNALVTGSSKNMIRLNKLPNICRKFV